jgi:hypothetical protein
MAERLPRYQQTGIAIDPYRAASMPSIDYSPLSRESRNLSQAQQGVLDRVINFAGKIGMEQAEEKGRAAVDTPEKAKQNCIAGSDIIVVGNAVEKDPTLIQAIAEAIHSLN